MMLSDGEPFVSLEVVEHLNKVYNLDTLLSRKERFFTNDEHMGYIKGVHDVISYLHALSIRKDDE